MQADSQRTELELVGEAIAAGDLERVRDLTSALELNSADGFELLVKAIKAKQNTIVEILLQAGSPIQVPDREWRDELAGMSVIHVHHRHWRDDLAGIAVEADNLDAIETLMRFGVDLNERQYERELPLSVAARKRTRSLDAMTKLIALGARVNQHDWQRVTPLIAAIDAWSMGNAEFLLERGADPNGKCALIAACKSGREQLVELLLNYGANVNYVGEGKNAIQVSAEAGYEKIVEILINAGADLDRVGPGTHATAFSLAVLAGKFGTARLLIDGGANMETGYWSEGTALHQAAAGESLALLRLLLQRGARVYIRNENGLLPIQTACQSGCRAEFLDELIKFNSDINCLTADQETLLHLAASTRYEYACIEKLVELNVDILAEDKYKQTALHRAAGSLNIRGLKILIKSLKRKLEASCSADEAVDRLKQHISARDAESRSPMSLASSAYPRYDDETHDRFESICELLVENGVDLSDDTSAMEGACKRTCLKTCQLLLDYGVDVNQRDKFGQISMHHAANSEGKKADELIDLLLRSGADVAAIDFEGKTIMHCVGENLKASSMEKFAELGVDLEARDSRGRTALHYAAEKTREEAVEFLISKGVDLEPQDENGDTPLHLAAKQNDHPSNTINQLLEAGASIGIVNNSGSTPDIYAEPIYRGCGQLDRSNVYTTSDEMLKLKLAGLINSGESLSSSSSSAGESADSSSSSSDDSVPSNYSSNSISCESSEYKRELAKMRVEMIEPNLSLYDFMTSGKLSSPRYTRNETLMKQLKTCHYATSFPIYINVIKGKIRRDELKMKALEAAAGCFVRLVEASKLSLLPAEIVDKILLELTKDELVMFANVLKSF